MSLRADKVQCSQGPQTLHSSSLWDRTSLWKPTEVYLRALIQLPKDEEGRESRELTGPAKASQLLPLTMRSGSDKQEKLPQMKEDQEKDAPGSQNRKSNLFWEPNTAIFTVKIVTR